MSPVNPAVAAHGKIMPLEELMDFNWYAEGVEGTIPK
jgi:hypothetical protein